jgi:lysozyme family protein
MLSNWPASIELVLKSEGHFVNHPSDPGGMTNLGVTKKAWEAWVKHPVDETEMRGLTPEIVAPFYKARYWDACKCDQLPLGVDYAVFDFAVNAGVGRASRTMQTALGTAADGIVGPATIGVATNADPDEFLEKFSAAKEQFYRNLPTFEHFGKGWLRRVSEVKQAADGMIA